MKILYVINSGKPGGVEQHVLDLTKSMIALGHVVYVWCLPGSIEAWYKDTGAHVFTNNRIRFDIDPLYVIDLAAFIIREQIDVVHAHELKASTNALLASFSVMAKVKITHIHTPMSEWQVRGLVKKLFTNLQIAGYACLINLLATREIALTDSRKKVKIAEGIRPEKLEVIPNALNFSGFDVSVETRQTYKNGIRSKYAIPDDAYVFGNIGRHTEEKGTDTLIRAFAQFVNRHSDKKYFLILGGGGKLEEANKWLANELGVADKVKITGVFPDDVKTKLYCSFDSFIFPSLAEGFGIVLMEAMYMALPVICSDLEVLREVGGNTINYFAKGNISDLVLRMQEQVASAVIDNVPARDRVRKEFSMDGFKMKYAGLYKKLLEAKNK